MLFSDTFTKHRFFTLLGTVFAFVSNDIRSKIEVLRKFLNDSDKQKSKQFLTVKKMIRYEQDNGLLQNSKYVSGCRTLLRLHRGLGKEKCLRFCLV